MNLKIQKLHAAQLKRAWNSNPTQRFTHWWNSNGLSQTEQNTLRPWTGIDHVRAYNCEAVRQVYREAKSYGLA